MEFALGVAAAARVDVGVDVAAAGEVGAAGMGGRDGEGKVESMKMTWERPG